MKQPRIPTRALATQALEALREHKRAIDYAIATLGAYAESQALVQQMLPRDELLRLIALARRHTPPADLRPAA